MGEFVFPAHWPKMVEMPQCESQEQAAVRALADVRKLVIAYRKHECEDDWRVSHAQTDNIINVIAGLIADAKAMDALYSAMRMKVNPLLEEISRLKEDLAESKRPFTAQMKMQNNTIIGLNAEISRLREALKQR